MMTGGISQPVEADAESQALSEQIRGNLEAKMSRKFDTFHAILVSRQVVAGTNHFIKIHVGNEECVHVRVFQPLPVYGTNPELHSYQSGKTKEDPLTYFD